LAVIDDIEDEESIPEEYFKISLIDRIISAFFESYSISYLLERLHLFIAPVVVDYRFNDVTYEGTLFDYRSGFVEENGRSDTNHQLTVRLSHDGFRYRKITGDFVVAKNVHYRESGEWYILNDEFMEAMPHLKNTALTYGSNATFYYSLIRKRIDIEYRKKKEKILCGLKFALKEGTQNLLLKLFN